MHTQRTRMLYFSNAILCFDVFLYPEVNRRPTAEILRIKLQFTTKPNDEMYRKQVNARILFLSWMLDVVDVHTIQLK